MNGTFPAEYPRLLRLAGGAVWIVVGFPVLTSFRQARASGSSPFAFAAWVAAFLLFAVAYAFTSREGRFERDRTGALLLLAGQSAAVLALVALPPCYGLEGALMVLVAIQLGGRIPPVGGVAWIVAQSALLFGAMTLHWNVHSGIMIAGAYFPFQLLAFWTAHLLAREGGARQGLARVNAELHATRDLLAESHRVSERLRIARDLHDVLGHHLTALALNLEVASHQVSGPAHAQIEAARDRSRELLGQIREAVRALRSGGDEIRLDAAIRRLAAGIPSPRVHVEFSEDLAVPDPASAQILLRCAQEIITNAVKHSRAENLWLNVVSRGGAIEIQARDDGQGSSASRPGDGLTGMRERLEERGGRLSVRSEPGAGFEVVAMLPAG